MIYRGIEKNNCLIKTQKFSINTWVKTLQLAKNPNAIAILE
ncbi:hypothetical protein [Calothrix anomala]|nr:hypothetical protein [Calothrix anomala]